MKEFIAMSGYGAYIWSAYAIAIGGLVLNIWLARRQQRVALREAKRRLAMRDNT
jgi:heme exporter protein CcmD